jgi:hypothetical protein
MRFKPAYSESVGVALCAARETGATMDECARVARIPLNTVNTWLRFGRAYLDADPADRIAAHEVYADLRVRMDAAYGNVRQTLRRTLLAAEDPRLALDYLKWLEGTETRRALLIKTKAEAAAAKAASKAIGAAETITLTLPASVSTPRTDGDDT